MSTITATFRTWTGNTIPQKRLALFFDSLFVQLNVGRPIAEALIDASHNSGDKELQQIFAVVAPKLRRGQSLCDTLRPYEQRFPELVPCILRVGEMSGGMADSAQRLSDTYKLILSAERELSVNAFNPKIVLLLFCFIDMIITICQALSSSAAQISVLSLAEKVVINVSSFAVCAIAAYFFMRALMHQLYRWKALRLIVDTIKLALPGLGIISRNLSAARWARSFAVLWSAGVNIATALEVSSSSALNSHYEREFRQAAIQTRQGRSLAECLKRTQLLPPHLLAIIRSSEETGRLDDQLLRLAADMERDALGRAVKEMNRIVMMVNLFLMLLAAIAILGMLTAS